MTKAKTKPVKPVAAKQKAKAADRKKTKPVSAKKKAKPVDDPKPTKLIKPVSNKKPVKPAVEKAAKPVADVDDDKRLATTFGDDNPTLQLTDALQRAFAILNVELFQKHAGALLPNLIFFPQRERRASIGGMFCPGSWNGVDEGSLTHSISYNPQHHAFKSARDVLMVVAHEMTHALLHERPDLYGPNGKGGFHGKPFAKAMKAIGLRAAKNGVPGATSNGVKMWHHEVTGEAFTGVADKMLADGWQLPWVPAPPVLVATKSKGGKRSSYCCPSCGSKASGKIGLSLYCCEDEDGEARLQMVETKPDGVGEED